ncbi:MAG: adenosylcobinamide-GDP ribazoletransferase [Deltaproteobacteria bacterium]|nr:adenosylcobinamide-GDP ribazoletransferase [Deltaproteobacteria bacterium]MBZ0220215.1 adenosylcobinamide-GDP ribazoletransferase [Deltaproteobacteria bacterium]
MKGFIIALQFLTVFRIGKPASVPEPKELARSMAWFPVIGALQGLILVLAYSVLKAFLPESVVLASLIPVLLLTNCGLHLDGFADTIDGLAGGRDREDMLRIMRDSSVGAIGAAGVTLLILLKFLSLYELPSNEKAWAIFLFPVVGRWAMVPLASFAGYARPSGGLGAAFAGNTKGVLLAATLLAVIMAAPLAGPFSILIFAALGVIIYMSSLYFKRKLGGVTGDVFGFHSEIAELLFLFGALAIYGARSTGGIGI